MVTIYNTPLSTTSEKALFGRPGGATSSIRYRRGPPTVRNMRAVLKKASWGTRRIFRGIRCKKQAFPVRPSVFHLLPSARQQIHPDIFSPSEGCPLPRAKEKPKTFQSSKKITKLASQEKDSII